MDNGNILGKIKISNPARFVKCLLVTGIDFGNLYVPIAHCDSIRETPSAPLIHCNLRRNSQGAPRMNLDPQSGPFTGMPLDAAPDCAGSQALPEAAGRHVPRRI